MSPLFPTARAESEAALKAEFLLKFAKFTDWPSSALSGDTPLAICVAGDPEVAEALGVIGDERRAVRAQPAVLSISDEKHFTRIGGIVELTLDNERMHSAVNVDAARRAGLQISSRLLNLATIVRDTRW